MICDRKTSNTLKCILPRPARQSTGSADIPATDEKGWDRRRERMAARQRILIKLQIYFKTEGVI